MLSRQNSQETPRSTSGGAFYSRLWEKPHDFNRRELKPEGFKEFLKELLLT